MELKDCQYLSPQDILFSQDSISNLFSPDRGYPQRKIGETLDELVEMKTFVTLIPPMHVVQFNDKWYSKNNRRLWVFRQLQLMKCIDYIPVRVHGMLPINQFTTLTGGKSIDVRGDHGSTYLKKFLSSQRAAQLEKVNALHNKPAAETRRHTRCHTGVLYNPRFRAALKNTPDRSCKTYQAIIRKYKQKLMWSKKEKREGKTAKVETEGYDFGKAKDINTTKEINFAADTVSSSDVFQFGSSDTIAPPTPVLFQFGSSDTIEPPTPVLFQFGSSDTIEPPTPVFALEQNFQQIPLLPQTPHTYTDTFGFPSTPAPGIANCTSTPTLQTAACNGLSIIEESMNWSDLKWPNNPDRVMDRQMLCLRRDYYHTKGTKPADYGDYDKLNTPVPLDNIRVNMEVPEQGRNKRKREQNDSPVSSKRRYGEDDCYIVSSTTDIATSNAQDICARTETIPISRTVVNNNYNNKRKKKKAKRKCGVNSMKFSDGKFASGRT